jgi:hypothetical protein
MLHLRESARRRVSTFLDFALLIAVDERHYRIATRSRSRGKDRNNER